MTTIQLEQRLDALERVVDHLKSQLNPSALHDSASDEGTPVNVPSGVPSDVECPVSLATPSRQEFRLRGKIVSIEPGRQEFGLSDAEWDSLHLEDGDERSGLV